MKKEIMNIAKYVLTIAIIFICFSNSNAQFNNIKIAKTEYSTTKHSILSNKINTNKIKLSGIDTKVKSQKIWTNIAVDYGVDILGNRVNALNGIKLKQVRIANQKRYLKGISANGKVGLGYKD